MANSIFKRVVFAYRSLNTFTSSVHIRVRKIKLNAAMENEENKLAQQTEQKPRKKIKKKSVIIYSSIGAAVIAAGVAGGILAGSNFWKAENPYDKIDITTLEKDYTETYEKFKNTSPDKVLDTFTDVELVNIAYMRMNDVDNYYSISKGKVKAAGVTQNVLSTMIKNGDDYFEENLSDSTFVKTANRFYQDLEEVKYYKGKWTKTGGDYSKAKLTTYTLEQFNDEWGKIIGKGSSYIITDQTCLKHERTTNSDGTVKFVLDLDPTYSVIKYVKTMIQNGGLSEAPIFHSVNMSLTVDADMKILEFSNSEVYDVHMVIDAKNSKANLTQTFFSEEREIPEIDTPTNYD